jgi:hypothetical protein
VIGDFLKMWEFTRRLVLRRLDTLIVDEVSMLKTALSPKTPTPRSGQCDALMTRGDWRMLANCWSTLPSARQGGSWYSTPANGSLPAPVADPACSHKSQPAAAGVHDVRRVFCILAADAATHTAPRSQRPSAASHPGTRLGHALDCRWQWWSSFTLTRGMELQLRTRCVHRMQIVFSGDFLQLPPVNKMEKVAEPICRCAGSA